MFAIFLRLWLWHNSALKIPWQLSNILCKILTDINLGLKYKCWIVFSTQLSNQQIQIYMFWHRRHFKHQRIFANMHCKCMQYFSGLFKIWNLEWFNDKFLLPFMSTNSFETVVWWHICFISTIVLLHKSSG